MPPGTILGRGYGTPTQIPPPLALRAYQALLGAFAPSIVPPNQKSWIHPWVHPPSENPGYASAKPYILTQN